MKRKTTLVLILLVAALLFPPVADAREPDDIHCILGFVTRDWNGNPFCQYTLPPGSCVICYASITVRL